MRQILVDHARLRNASKRGSGAIPVAMVDIEQSRGERVEDLIALDEALTKFEWVEPRKARVVELKFFGGLTVDEVARLLDVSRRTVLLDWNFAKAWLYREIGAA
jgi:RNA polymerase sigma factor (TIGR02999 family)